MRQVVLILVLTLLRSALGVVPSKSCNDCTNIFSCDAALILVNKKESAANDKLRSAFCGLDNERRKPKVCCSELSGAEATSTVPGSGSIEGHPNLRLLPKTCGVNHEDRVIVGITVGLYEYPWMVLISYKTRNGLQFSCAGSLINERYVLIAAHCISGKEIAGARVGEFDFSTATDCQGNQCESHIQDLRIEETITHPDYHGAPTINNDIGLIRLNTPVDLTFKNAKTICLPVTKDLQERDLVGFNATAAGLGFTEAGYASSRLQALDIHILPQDNCSHKYNRGKAPGDTIDFTKKLCAGGYGRSTCAVNSGPLMVRGTHNNEERFIQHGILSFGSKVCSNDYPVVYTDVTKYMKWILDTIKP